MINYGRFQFYSAPRTGTTWMLKALAVAGFGEKTKTEAHIPPSRGEKPLSSLTIVRHPYHWLESFYQAIGGGLIGVDEVDYFSRICRETNTFREFVEVCFDRHPTPISRMFGRYCSSMALRTFDLPDAGIEFFETLGVSITPDLEKKIRLIGRPNSRIETPLHRDDWAYRVVMAAEAEFCDQYEFI